MIESILTPPPDANPLLKRAILFLESGDFASAVEYSGKVLDTEPENAVAYLIHLMAARNLNDERQLAFAVDLANDPDFKFARRFASPELAAKLDAIAAETEKNQALKPLRMASAERQRMLQQFLAAGLSSPLEAEVRQRIDAEQALVRLPDAAVAAQAAAAMAVLAAKVELYQLMPKIRERLSYKGITVSNAQAADMCIRLERAEALLNTPMPDLGTLQYEIRKCKDALDETRFNKMILAVLIAVLGLVLVALAFGTSGYWSKWSKYF